jgi:hypothetical protein
VTPRRGVGIATLTCRWALAATPALVAAVPALLVAVSAQRISTSHRSRPDSLHNTNCIGARSPAKPSTSRCASIFSPSRLRWQWCIPTSAMLAMRNANANPRLLP